MCRVSEAAGGAADKVGSELGLPSDAHLSLQVLQPGNGRVQLVHQHPGGT